MAFFFTAWGDSDTEVTTNPLSVEFLAACPSPRLDLYFRLPGIPLDLVRPASAFL